MNHHSRRLRRWCWRRRRRRSTAVREPIDVIAMFRILAGLLRAFDTHRDLIYATAYKVYSRGRKGLYDLLSGDF